MLLSSTFWIFVLGLGLLLLGAELLVRGASRLAIVLRISPLVVGLTVVAYGTSAAELAVCLRAVFTQQGSLAIATVVGSNIFNVLFVLGVSAAIRPLSVHRRLIRVDVPLMIGASVLCYAFAYGGLLRRWHGVVLLLGAVAYTVFIVLGARRERSQSWELTESGVPATVARTKGPLSFLIQAMLILIGLVLITVGARYLVTGAISVAKIAGISETVIGLTIVAASTSLPEAAASIVATLRGKREIAVGNVVGSNVCNLLLGLGASALLAPSGIEVPTATLRFDMPVMIVVAVSCLPVFFIGNQIARWEGALFISYYIAFVLFLVMQAGHYEALPRFSLIMLTFVIPLTAVTLIVLTVRTARANRRSVAGTT